MLRLQNRQIEKSNTNVSNKIIRYSSNEIRQITFKVWYLPFGLLNKTLLFPRISKMRNKKEIKIMYIKDFSNVFHEQQHCSIRLVFRWQLFPKFFSTKINKHLVLNMLLKFKCSTIIKYNTKFRHVATPKKIILENTFLQNSRIKQMSTGGISSKVF